ncbi:MAG: DUF5113 domain-containing protein [Bacteroides sp.]|nr:DUF5113 domain-containing protein [Bacteroides sp.]
MRKATPVLPIFIIIFMVTSLFSCGEIAPTLEVRLVDSLNEQSYAYRYRNLDSAFRLAGEAWQAAQRYNTGKAEALNHLGFCAFMQMDFEKAEKLHRSVLLSTQNEVERLIADIGLMKVYQRTSMNKEFYDSRNSARRRMRRIDEDISIFVDTHEKHRLWYAYSEFYIVSALYYHYLQQSPEAVTSLRMIENREELSQDINQQLSYYFVKGSSGLSGGETREERVVREFDNLYFTWDIARQADLIYFEGSALQILADLLMEGDNQEIIGNNRSQRLKNLGDNTPEFPLSLTRQALTAFQQYPDIYQLAATYVTIGKYLNKTEEYSQALDTLTKALQYVNLHHTTYYTDHHLEPDSLLPYDTVMVELEWIEQAGIKTVPEWISRIREQLSVTYSGLGMKVPSNYNRNIYLDILDITRQDKELESRYAALAFESRQLNLIMFMLVAGLLLLFLFFWIINARSRKRNQLYTERLRLTLDICHEITASIPEKVTTEEEIIHTILSSIHLDMKKLLGALSLNICLAGTPPNEEPSEPTGVRGKFPLLVPDKEEPVGYLELYTLRRLNKDQRAFVHVITPYIAWTLDSGLAFVSLSEEEQRLEKQRYIYEQHIAENKRQNIIKKACMAIVNGITPFLDRILNEVRKLDAILKEEKNKPDVSTQAVYREEPEAIKKNRYQYIDELVTTINEYNDILALWIKIKQGTISLNIENFALQDLFNLIGKGRKTFEMKNQDFIVEPTDTVVKADKALTLFMLNTLTENARKYTPEGGTIRVYATREEKYIEISVEDTGIGLSQKDIRHIIGEKIYNSKEIGLDTTSDKEALIQNKGSGFGLMNCKGIIDKYRKTNTLFQVCTFNVESEPGKGSRFYFRIPRSIRKTFICILLFISAGLTAQVPENQSYFTWPVDSLSATPEHFEQILSEASAYADSAYFANILERYEEAIQYIDSAIWLLNLHYELFAIIPAPAMSITGEESPAELLWWENDFLTDYHVILDLRNEASVAFLALKDWNAYTYNNTAYTGLYKLLSEDYSLEDYCRRLENSTNNKIVGIILCGLLLLTLFMGYYILYIRKRLHNRMNLEQVFDINKRIFASSLVRSSEETEALQREEDALSNIPRQIVEAIYESINELFTIDNLCIAVYNEKANQLECASAAVQSEVSQLMERCFEQKRYLYNQRTQVLPLIVDAGGKQLCVGVMGVTKENTNDRETDQLLLELIGRYVAIVIFNTVLKPATKYRDIEEAHEDARRASWEDGILHIQNMVLNNCLSTIKHETIYYPNKIKQIVDKLRKSEVSVGEEEEQVSTLRELAEYYKGIFTILSSCAAHQLEEVTFRRTTIQAETLLEYATKYMRKASRNHPAPPTLMTEFSPYRIKGDITQLKFLLENLINEALTYPKSGEIYLSTKCDGEYIRFSFNDTRREKGREEPNHLFYPDLSKMQSGSKGELTGTEYLICKQIIREHDEFAGRRGCRINAEPGEKGGFTVYFTIPEKKERE